MQDNEAIRERALKLTQRRQQYGLSTQLLDVAREQNQLSDLQSRIPRTQATIQHQLSLIAIYSGRTPESVDKLMLADAGSTPAILVPASGTPQMLSSDALLRRPNPKTRTEASKSSVRNATLTFLFSCNPDI